MTEGMDLDALRREQDAEKSAKVAPVSRGGRNRGKFAWQPVCLCGHTLAMHSPSLIPPDLRDRYPWDFDEETRSRSTRIVQESKYGVEGCFGSLQHYGKYDDRTTKTCSCESFDFVLEIKRLGHYFRHLPTKDHPSLYLAIRSANEYLLGERKKPPAPGAMYRWVVPQRCHRCGDTGGGVLPYYATDEENHPVRLGCRTCREGSLGGVPL